MDQPVVERRCDARVAATLTARATIRGGSPVVLIDVSAGGALVEGSRPLRPGATIQLQIVSDGRTHGVVAHVLRCVVWSLDPDAGVTYRGALRFERNCELFQRASLRAEA